MDDAMVQTVCSELGDIEFHATYLNPHGTGYTVIVSNPLDGRVDIVFEQIVCHERPDEPSLTLSLPYHAALALLTALNNGVSVANHMLVTKNAH